MEKMKIQIIGDGSFGSFLKELMADHFDIVPEANSVILAVPMSAYEAVAKANKDKHLINVCSVQKPSTDICLKYSSMVTSLHPLFGRRTSPEYRNTIVSYTGNIHDIWYQDDLQVKFLDTFGKVSRMYFIDETSKAFTPATHDKLMEKTHLAAMMAAKQLKVYTDRVAHVPDYLIPNSFRMMRNFVKTLDDMPAGTIESIMANPYL
jgi:prephenate dehydrogenase